MFAHLTTLTFYPGRLDDAIQIYTHTIIPFMQQQPGCRFVTLLTAPAQHELIAIGWWENEADLLTVKIEPSYRQFLSEIERILATPPVSASYCVSYQVAPL